MSKAKSISYKRHVHGILLLDKPAGITSNDALQKIKRLYRATKAGHTGSLDKTATGLLPLCLGEATKISSYLLNADKTYVTTGKLGVTTSTGDAAGEVLEISPVPLLKQSDLEGVITQFVGDIKQVPPMYSALKIAGQRLYKLAYQGIHVTRQARSVRIYQIDLLNFVHESLTIQVHCSKGTYIRTLIEDIGHALGCGAHVVTLRRLSTGVFNIEQTVTIQHIEELLEKGGGDDALLDQLLLPIDSALEHLTKICLSEQQTSAFRHGRSLLVSDALNAGLVRVYDHQHKFIGIGITKDGGYIVPTRLLRHDLS